MVMERVMVMVINMMTTTIKMKTTTATKNDPIMFV